MAPALERNRSNSRKVKVGIIADYGLTGIRLGEQVTKDMIAVL